MRPMWLRMRKKAPPKAKLTQSEGYVVRQTKKAAKAAGYIHRKINYANRNGAPDDWFFGFDGDLIIIEFKATDKTPEPHQEIEIKELRKRGFKVYVIDSAEAGKGLFEGRNQW